MIFADIGYECIECEYVLDITNQNEYQKIALSEQCPKCGGFLHQFDEDKCRIG